MAKVVALGGIFFKAKDPAATGAFYRDRLGMPLEAWGSAKFDYRDADGHTQYNLWSPFPESTEYFRPSDKPFMVNLRVDDLDGLLAKLRADGVEVLERREEGEFGKFGYVIDPDGILVELWEAPPAAAAK